jgi:hypothetical protein
MENIDRTMSLSQLIDKTWNEDNLDTQIVYNIQRLWRLPLKEYTPSDLREMINSNIGIRYLVPLALELLSKQPLLEANFFPGDLLDSVIGIKTEYWLQHSLYKDKIIEISRSALTQLDSIQSHPTLTEMLQKSLISFLSKFNGSKIA